MKAGGEVLKKRFEIEGTGAGAGAGGQGELYDYLRATKNGAGRGGDSNEWEDEPSEEVFLARALAAIKTANTRGDGVVEMEEREWQAWKLHEAMEHEIEKRVAEREMEREMQRERDLARAEELQRELDMLRQSTRRGSPAGGEPGFMLDQGFAPLGGTAYTSNSSPASSLARPYSTMPPRREGRFMPDSTDPLFAQNVRPALLPRDQQREYQTYPTPSSFRSVPVPQQSSPAPSYMQPTTKTPASTSSTASPRRSNSRSSSLTRDGHRSRRRSITASTSVPPGADLAPGGSYHPGVHPSIPTSHSAGSLGAKVSGKKGRKGESEGEEEVYTSAAAALKDVRRRRRV